MIPQGLIAQIGMLILSVGIFFSYIQPTYNAISATNEQIDTIKIERDKVSSVNDMLNSHLAKAQELTAEERRGMDVYLPASIDSVAVQRDLLSIATEANIQLAGLAVGEVIPAAVTDGTETSVSKYTKLQRQTFTTTFSVSYQNLKYFLGLLETNNYPLFVRDLVITENTTEGNRAGTVGVELVVETYGFSLPDEAPLLNE